MQKSKVKKGRDDPCEIDPELANGNGTGEILLEAISKRTQEIRSMVYSSFEVLVLEVIDILITCAVVYSDGITNRVYVDEFALFFALVLNKSHNFI